MGNKKKKGKTNKNLLDIISVIKVNWNQQKKNKNTFRLFDESRLKLKHS